MDLNEVAVFIKVIQTGSFSRAAKELVMPNSTVSSKISSLERRLGVTLIQRTTRKLNITPAGQSYFQRCIQGLEEIQAAEAELAALQGEPQGLLRITAPVELGSSVLPGLISDFTKRYPKVKVEAILSDRRVDLLSESVDLAIRAGELKDSTLIAKKVGTVYFVPVASPRYLKAHGTPIHPRELSLHTCLAFSPVGTDEWRLVSNKGSLNIPINSRVITNDFNMVKILTLKGDGISLMPTFYCAPEVQSGKLVRIFPEWRTHLTPVHFVYAGQKFVTPKLSAFIEMATDVIRRSFDNFEI